MRLGQGSLYSKYEAHIRSGGVIITIEIHRVNSNTNVNPEILPDTQRLLESLQKVSEKNLLSFCLLTLYQLDEISNYLRNQTQQA